MLRTRALRYLKRTGFAVGGVFLLYLLVALLGLIPVNNEFSADPDGVQIFVFSGEFHTDIILPLNAAGMDWRLSFPDSDFLASSFDATHVAIGWGERNFYLHTPTWSDLKLSTAAKALLVPSATVMHVEMTTQPKVGQRIRRVRISASQYESLCEFVESSFDLDANGQVQRIVGENYGFYDAFYEANGSYHAFRTCNCWGGEALRSAGVRVGWFTPLPKAVFVWLPNDENP